MKSGDFYDIRRYVGIDAATEMKPKTSALRNILKTSGKSLQKSVI